MAMVPFVVAYIAIGIFVIAVAARFFMWSRMPLHMRWELYPVAHEGKRARYGGSYLEETDWWTKPREVSLLGEVKAMFMEIVFLVALKEHNYRLWLRSFPFHFGLYLLVACTLLMALNGVLVAVAPALLEGVLGSVLRIATAGCGIAGLCLGFLGALGLFIRRVTDPALKDYTTAADRFNLLFFVVAFCVALLNVVLVDRDLSWSTAFVAAMVRLDPITLSGTTLQVSLGSATIILLSLLVAYIPLTHMSHFVGKYFAYHAIRWNDTPNLRGGNQEETIKTLLDRPVSWAAPHIQGDGKKSWVDVATKEPSQ